MSTQQNRERQAGLSAARAVALLGAMAAGACDIGTSSVHIYNPSPEQAGGETIVPAGSAGGPGTGGVSVVVTSTDGAGGSRDAAAVTGTGGTGGRGGNPLVMEPPADGGAAARDAGADALAFDARPADGPPPPKGECPDLDGNGVLDCRESALMNPDFKTATTGWKAEANASATFSSEDGDGTSGSGAVAVTNAASGDVAGAAMAGVRQCVSTQGGVAYVLHGQMRLEDAQGATAGISVQLFTSADCVGTVSAAHSTSLHDSQPGWRPLQSVMMVPQGIRSMAVRLIVVKPFRQAAVTALFDNVLLKAR